jgi:hypothetical protein
MSAVKTGLVVAGLAATAVTSWYQYFNRDTYNNVIITSDRTKNSGWWGGQVKGDIFIKNADGVTKYPRSFRIPEDVAAKAKLGLGSVCQIKTHGIYLYDEKRGRARISLPVHEASCRPLTGKEKAGIEAIRPAKVRPGQLYSLDQFTDSFVPGS